MRRSRRPRRRPSRPARTGPQRTRAPRGRARPARTAPDANAAPRCLGLTGGIGAGKSLALAAFARLGAAVLSADDLVHEAYRDPGLVEEVRARFGDAAVRPDGTIDRAALGRLAFADAGATRDLERLVHPGVAAARDRWVAAQRARVPPPPLLVCEVPLLYEAGLEDRFDAVLVVTAPEEVRRERVARRGQDFSARSARQVSEEVKVARADRYVVNDGTPSDLEAWVAARFAEYAL